MNITNKSYTTKYILKFENKIFHQERAPTRMQVSVQKGCNKTLNLRCKKDERGTGEGRG